VVWPVECDQPVLHLSRRVTHPQAVGAPLHQADLPATGTAVLRNHSAELQAAAAATAASDGDCRDGGGHSKHGAFRTVGLQVPSQGCSYGGSTLKE